MVLTDRVLNKSKFTVKGLIYKFIEFHMNWFEQEASTFVSRSGLFQKMRTSFILHVSGIIPHQKHQISVQQCMSDVLNTISL